jgi:hypothetical protein
MSRAGKLVLAVFLAVASGFAQTPIAEAEALNLPTAGRLATIHAAAQRDGWAPHREVLRSAALRAYEREKFSAAEAWLNAYRWAALWSEAEPEFLARWVQAMQSRRLAHPNMPRRYDARPRPLAASLTPALQGWMFGNSTVSAEFFSLLTPVDFLPRVFEILEELHRKDAVRFKSYVNLALAIAVVYDVPPPPNWPHGQVSAEALPRQFAAPAEAFDWWVRQDQRGRTYHKLTRLGPDELKFVVDTVAPLAELDWIQSAVDLPLNQLARGYSMVRYRVDRITSNQMRWTGRTYTLAEILSTVGSARIRRSLRRNWARRAASRRCSFTAPATMAAMRGSVFSMAIGNGSSMRDDLPISSSSPAMPAIRRPGRSSRITSCSFYPNASASCPRRGNPTRMNCSPPNTSLSAVLRRRARRRARR